MESVFQVGDRVVVTENHDYARKGMTGTVVVVKNVGASHKSLGIHFDEKFEGGHSLSGKCPDGYGHWVPPHKLEFEPENTAVDFDEFL